MGFCGCRLGTTIRDVREVAVSPRYIFLHHGKEGEREKDGGMDGRQAVANREWLGVGVVWLGGFSKCVVLVVVVVRRCESGLFCFVSFRSHIRRKEAGPGWGLMVLFSCLFLSFGFCFFLLVRTCFTSSCCGFPPPLAPFSCAYFLVRLLTFRPHRERLFVLLD